MSLSPGTRVLLESESVNRPARRGTVEEVLREDPSPRYRIRWDDGHETIHTPAAGALFGAESPGRGSRRSAQA
jgi:hypothetical protein